VLVSGDWASASLTSSQVWMESGGVSVVPVVSQTEVVGSLSPVLGGICFPLLKGSCAGHIVLLMLWRGSQIPQVLS
jgi:hypothetical protein